MAFTSRFTHLDSFGHTTYVVTSLLAVVSSAVLATPVTLHRVPPGKPGPR
ncbi:DUF6328 family protein [Streptomyces sp. NPDC001890]